MAGLFDTSQVLLQIIVYLSLELLILCSAPAVAEEIHFVRISRQFYCLTWQRQTGTPQEQILTDQRWCKQTDVVPLHFPFVSIESASSIKREGVCLLMKQGPQGNAPLLCFPFFLDTFLFATLAFPNEVSMHKLCLRLYFLGNLG